MPEKRSDKVRHLTYPRRPGCVVILIVLLPFAVWMAMRSLEATPGWTVKQVEQLIDEEFSPEWRRADAIAWLDRHAGWHQVAEYGKGEVGGRLGHQTFAEIADLDESKLSCVVWAWMYPANVDWLFTGRIDVYFFFDTDGRFAGKLVSPFAYAL